MTLEHVAEGKEPDTQGHIVYYVVYMKRPDEANPKRQEIDWWLPAGSCKGWEGWGVTASRM